MTQTIQLEIVAPEKLLFSEHVEMVVVPGTEGDFGVLINHAPLLAAVRPGVVTIYRDEHIIERIFISGGFAEVTAVSVSILTEEASILDSLKREEIERKLSLAIEALKNENTPLEHAKAESQVIILETMLNAMS